MVRAIALDLKDLPGETRTLAQIEADVFRDLLLDPPDWSRRRRTGSRCSPARARCVGCRRRRSCTSRR